jgi:hypothetical protein
MWKHAPEGSFSPVRLNSGHMVQTGCERRQLVHLDNRLMQVDHGGIDMSAHTL